MRSEGHEALQMELARARLLSVVAQAEAEYAAGSFVNAGRIFQDMQEGYDL